MIRKPVWRRSRAPSPPPFAASSPARPAPRAGPTCIDIETSQREQDRIAARRTHLTARAEPEPDLELALKVVERAFAIIDNIAEAYLRASERDRAMWNEAVFAGIWIGDREIKRTECRDLFASGGH